MKFPFSFIVLNIFVSFTEKNPLQHYTFDDEIQLWNATIKQNEVLCIKKQPHLDNYHQSEPKRHTLKLWHIEKGGA